MHLNVFASQSCFVHCKGCYSYSREERPGKIFPTDKLVSFLQYAHDVGVPKITLCGGDPLARDDIIDLLEEIKEIGFRVSLDTVGSPIIKNASIGRRKVVNQLDAKRIAELVDVIGIPIDGSTNEIFKRFRNTKSDIVNEQLAICQELHKYGANICINTVAHKGNLEDAHELAKLIRGLDYINKWQIFQYMPLGKYGVKNRKLFEITDEEFSNFQSDVLEVFDNDITKLQFKSSSDRMNTYMLIDNSGNAWIPSSDNKSPSNENGNRIIGNISNPNEWYKICSLLDREIPVSHQLQNNYTSGVEARQRFVNAISNNGEYRNLPQLQQTTIGPQSAESIIKDNLGKEESER